LYGSGGFVKTPALSYLEIFNNLPYFYILYLISGILDTSSSQIYPSAVTKKQSASFWKAIDYEATKNYLSFIPIRIGDPFVVVHILCGCYLSIATIPHCGLTEVYFITSSVFLMA
jgi:hypothetical protein